MRSLLTAKALVLACLSLPCTALPRSQTTSSSACTGDCPGEWLVEGSPMQFNFTAAITAPSGSGQFKGWYYNVIIGNTPAQLLLDTGTAATIVNPNISISSSQAISNASTVVVNADYLASTTLNNSFTNVQASLYNDSLSVGPLNVQNQVYEKLSTSGVSIPSGGPGDGVLGLGVANSIYPSLIQNACAQKLTNQCRFGLVFNSDQTGALAVGAWDSSIGGSISNADSVAPYVGNYVSQVNVTANGTAIASNVAAKFSSGSLYTIGPSDTVSRFFAASGIQSTQVNNVTYGTYPCDHPPTSQFGLQFLNSSATNAGKTTNVATNQHLAMLQSAWSAFQSNGNTCTVSIAGYDFETSAGYSWVIGQSWFQGKYVDFNLAASQITVMALGSSSNGIGSAGTAASTSGAVSLRRSRPQATAGVQAWAWTFGSVSTMVPVGVAILGAFLV